LQHDFGFRFLGLVGLEDPVRADVPKAVAQCREAGIRVVMMTGDHSATAVAVARQAGLNADAPPITGVELAALSDEELQARLAEAHIFSRVQPDQKLRLVRAFGARGDVVAMKMPPRRADQRLFDRVVLIRGLWQGTGLLALLVAVYAGGRLLAPPEGDGDDLARTLTFVVLVLSNLALIHANRSWGRGSWRGNRESNKQFGWIAVGTIVLLGVVLAVPAARRLFSFASPPAMLLVTALGASSLSWLWFECSKWASRRLRLRACTCRH
jgi:magnesium-transporting ATPase (P-type)